MARNIGITLLASIIVTACSGSNVNPPPGANAALQTSFIQSTLVAPALPHFKEFPLPTPALDQPDHLTEGGDGNMWFVTDTFARIGRITPAGVVTVVTPAPTATAEIAWGPDGNLWFGAHNSINFVLDYLCKIAPSTATIGACVSTGEFNRPISVAAGPAASMWFQYYNGLTKTYGVGAVEVAGSTAQTCPDAPIHGGDLVTGPDKRVWTSGAGVIGRYTTPLTCPPKGTLYQVAGVNGLPIVVGPDKNLWFVDGGAIGRITTAGVVTNVFPITGITNAQVHCMATGPDGDVWFTLPLNNLIGKITTSGVATLFPVNGQPDCIARGPNGSMWVTEYAANKIATFTP